MQNAINAIVIVVVVIVIVVIVIVVIVIIVVVIVVVIVGKDALNHRVEVVIISTLPLDSCRGPWFAVVKCGHESCMNPCDRVSNMVTRCASMGSLLTFGWPDCLTV